MAFPVLTSTHPNDTAHSCFNVISVIAHTLTLLRYYGFNVSLYRRFRCYSTYCLALVIEIDQLAEVAHLPHYVTRDSLHYSALLLASAYVNM